jgi:hypothetical protein
MAPSDAKLGLSGPLEAAEPKEGFDGQLRCASLADLIQLQCGNRAKVAVSVRSENREGVLFFDDGQIVHAVCGNQVGEDAVNELLEWTTGSFGQSNEPWPDSPSISSSWQQLLLTAAQRRDEAQQGLVPAMSQSRLSAVKRPPPSRPLLPPPSRAPETPSHLPRPVRKASLRPSRAPKAGPLSIGLENITTSVRLDDEGNAIDTRGEGEKLIGLGVYVRRLAELIGQGLGQAGFQAFECRSETGALVVFVDTPGSYVIAETATPTELRHLYRTQPG